MAEPEFTTTIPDALRKRMQEALAEVMPAEAHAEAMPAEAHAEVRREAQRVADMGAASKATSQAEVQTEALMPGRPSVLEAGDLAGGLARAALDCLQRVLASRGERASALDLLAADALLTESVSAAAAEGPAAFTTLAEEALASIAGLLSEAGPSHTSAPGSAPSPDSTAAPTQVPAPGPAPSPDPAPASTAASAPGLANS